MADALDAYLNENFVGRLREEKGRLFFAYDKAWLESRRFIPLSVTMPRQAEEFADATTRAFFDNLLPEGDIRAAIAKLKRVSERNTFGLLEEIGGDCAGAISLWPEGEKPGTHEGYAPISDRRLNKVFADMRKRPLLAIDDGLRLSLAGAQDKLPVYYDGTRLALPWGSAPSSHILKPGSAGFAHMPVNEHFCMRLAAASGLPVPQSVVLRKANALYLVQRYDRIKAADGTLSRIHQVDFCQALNLPSSRKYEKEGGPGLSACFDVIAKYCAQPAKDRLEIISWVIFNYLLGNADAHAKNLSLLITSEGVSLAPSYDLISTVVYRDLTLNLALKIGGEDRPEWIQERHWRAFADGSGANPRIVWRRMAELSAVIPGKAREVLAALDPSNEEREMLERICSVAERRAARLAGLKAVRPHS
ncbi:MAG: type II toxin-antitoxin system HipA family toxin [Betaproteobacteria bacterium]|nr:type II toxin-antitoxin system HipA family toxin [Betaproteobacteria bacterium]